MPIVTMTVNGEVRSAEVEGRTLLAQFLREHLPLTGTHVECDTNQYGACTVQVDGEAIKFCSTLALACDGANLVTIEGLAIDGIQVDSEGLNSDIRGSAEYRAHAVIVMAKRAVEVAVSR
jgi:aerobic-type carbon monoxide dehydrogenase small subunit (CoxS/CutS family)